MKRTLTAILAAGAVNALAGGVYGLLGAKGIPRSWLDGSPFHDYFVPSLILVVVVGGALSAAAIAVWRGARNANVIATAAGVITIGWIVVQLAIIGFVSWLQPFVAVMGITILALARRHRPTLAG